MKVLYGLGLGFCSLIILSCAITDEEYMMDAGSTDLDTDADSDTDADTDTDTDADCDCSDSSKQACCSDDNCTYRAYGTVCDSQYETEYSCAAESPSCGSSIYLRHKERLCTGYNWLCTGEITDWGEWIESEKCEPHQKCQETLGGGDSEPPTVECVDSHESCATDFGVRMCFPGETMKDCPKTGCPDPWPSLTENAFIEGVGSDNLGEVVQLEIQTPDRGNVLGFPEGAPFTDIKATLSHNGQTVSFYNYYASNATALLQYRFRKLWPIPNFWGKTMNGEWTLYLEDHATSPEGIPLSPFKLTEWCLTFKDPETTDFETTGKRWRQRPQSPDNVIFPGETNFEQQVTDLVKADSDVPVLYLDIADGDSTDLAIFLIAANGQTITVKTQSSPVIPYSVTLSELEGTWLTGRYQLKIQNTAGPEEDLPILNAWSINVGVPDVDIDIDTDSATDTGVDTDTDTDTDLDVDAGDDGGPDAGDDAGPA